MPREIAPDYAEKQAERGRLFGRILKILNPSVEKIDEIMPLARRTGELGDDDSFYQHLTLFRVDKVEEEKAKGGKA